MPITIELPHVGESVTEGIIGKWLKQVGDYVDKYDPLVEIVTDKVNMEVPSPESGVLTAILVQEGEKVAMGNPIAEMEPSAGGIPPQEASAEHPVGTTGVFLEESGPIGPTGAREPEAIEKEAPTEARPRYSPVVQRLAQEHGIDLAQVKGTGLGGRVTRGDVLSHVEAMKAVPATPTPPEAAPVSQEDEAVSLTPTRRLIAENMVRSVSQIPQAWTTIETDVTNMVRRREAVKEDLLKREGIELTYLAFVVKAVAESLKEHPLLNSTWSEDKIILKKRINIGIAVAAPRGLVVPVIHDADAVSIAGLARAISDLATRAREDRLILSDVQGGTFTVNNTGVLGSIISQPIVNFPQAAILTTEAIVKRPVVIDDAIAIRSMMNICLTFDHRILDGAEVGAFLTSVKGRLESIGPNMAIC